MTCRWVAVQKSHHVCLLEVRKEAVRVEKCLGRVVIGQAEKQSRSLYWVHIVPASSLPVTPPCSPVASVSPAVI